MRSSSRRSRSSRHTGVSRVLLEATVMDKADRFVGDLDAASFRVLENDEPQTIDLATVESLPVTYTLLVDASQSMHARMEFVRAAAGRLADFLRPDDRIIVAPFAKSLGAITGPTGDRETIAGAVQAISSSGGTAISDGLIEASRLVPGTDRRHVIVLITDGYDEHSQTKMEDALAAAQSAHAAVYVIGVGGVAGISLKGERALRQIAQQTGGRVFFPSREQELPAVHELVAEDVQQRYLLTYSPANQDADGAWRRITLSTTDSSHRIRTRAGYFAPKPPPVRPSLEFTVTGANRELVDLTRDDLVVLEDGVAQQVDTFQEAVAPVSVVLALDASGSMTKAADGVRAAALSFVEALRPEDALSVLLFSDTSAFAHDLTTDRQQSISAVNAYDARGGTALYDGLTDALMRLKQTDGRKVVVLLSDGRDEDNAGTGPGSARTQQDVFAALSETDATIYPIGLGPRVDRAAAGAAGCRVRRCWRIFRRTSRTCATTTRGSSRNCAAAILSATRPRTRPVMAPGGRLRSRLVSQSCPSGAGAAIPRRESKAMQTGGHGNDGLMMLVPVGVAVVVAVILFGGPMNAVEAMNDIVRDVATGALTLVSTGCRA